MSADRPLRVAVVAGEESGDLLGADLVAALKAATGRRIELFGVGGRHLESHGLKSLFDGEDIALMGVTAVLRDLPRLVWRIGSTARAIAEFAPDCLVTIDSPAFGLRVARRFKARRPDTPVIHYVCPSVWAWGPWRARRMRGHVDRILCLLPFEPRELERLEGPPGTYVGHKLARDGALAETARLRADRGPVKPGAPRRLLVLPGSRRSELGALMPAFGEIVGILAARGHTMELVLPTLPRLAELAEKAAADWPVRPRIVVGEEARRQAFAEADAAIAASGTVLLELALAGVPAVSCYRTDLLFRMLMMRLVTVWSAALPNLIADGFVVSEYIDNQLRPGLVARLVEQLWREGPLRQAQMEGYARVRVALATDRAPGEIAADAVLEALRTA